MDVALHFRAIWHRRWLVLTVAVAVGTLVLVARLFAPVTWSAAATLYVVPSSDATASPNQELRRLTAGYVGFANDSRVLEATGAAGTTPQQVRLRTKVSSPEDGVVTVVATGPTAVEAVDLAEGMAQALSAAAERDQQQTLLRNTAPLTQEVADLTRQLESLPANAPARGDLQDRLRAVVQARTDRLSAAPGRLDIVDRPRVADATSSPHPARDAVLAFLVTLVLAAEAAALLAARRGGLEGADPQTTLQEWTGLPVFTVGGRRDEAGGALLYLLNGEPGSGRVRRPHPVAAVAPLNDGPGERAVVLRLLETAAALRGTARLLVLAGEPPEAPRGASVLGPPQARPELADQQNDLPEGAPVLLTAPTWDCLGLLQALAAEPDALVVAVDARTVRRGELAEALRVLRAAGAEPDALVVQADRGRTLRRRPSEKDQVPARAPASSARAPQGHRPADTTEGASAKAAPTKVASAKVAATTTASATTAPAGAAGTAGTAKPARSGSGRR